MSKAVWYKFETLDSSNDINLLRSSISWWLVCLPVNPSPHPWISPTYSAKGRVSFFLFLRFHFIAAACLRCLQSHIKLPYVVASKKPFFFLGGSPWLYALRWCDMICVNQRKPKHNPVCERVLNEAPGGGMAFAPAKSPASSSCSFFFLKLQRQHSRLLLQSFPFGGSLPKRWEQICPNPHWPVYSFIIFVLSHAACMPSQVKEPVSLCLDSIEVLR